MMMIKKIFLAFVLFGFTSAFAFFNQFGQKQQIVTQVAQKSSAKNGSVVGKQTLFGAFSQKKNMVLEATSSTSKPSGQMLNTDSMESRIEPREKSSVAMFISLPGSSTKKAYEKALHEIANDDRVNIPGFRKGAKIPEDMICAAVGPEVVRQTAIEILSEQALKLILQDHPEIKAAGQASLATDPKELEKSFEPGQPMDMELKMDVIPEPTFSGSYKGLIATVEKEPIEQDRVDAALKSLRQRKAVLQDVEDENITAALGQSLLVNMRAFEKNEDGSQGEELSGIAAGDEVELIMEEGRFLPGVVDGLVGAKIKEERMIDVTFPQSIREPKLAGKDAVFKIEIVSIKTRVLPEINDEFANSIRAGLTKDELMQEIISAVNSDAEQKTKANRNGALEEQLAKVVEMDVPESWIFEETRRKFAAMMSEFAQQGTPDEEIKKMVSKENFDRYMEVSLPRTTTTLKLSAAIAKIGRDEGLIPDEQEVQDQVDLARMDAKGKQQEFDEDVAKTTIEGQMISTMVMDFLAEHATLTFVDVDPEEREKKQEEAMKQQREVMKQQQEAREAMMKQQQEQNQAPPQTADV
jgi:trigger factor